MPDPAARPPRYDSTEVEEFSNLIDVLNEALADLAEHRLYGIREHVAAEHLDESQARLLGRLADFMGD